MLNIRYYIPNYLPTIIVLTAICYLSLAPDPLPDSKGFFHFYGSDKVVHCIMYLALTFTFCFDYIRHRRDTVSYKNLWLATALIIAIAIGSVIEILQAYMALGRSGDILDLVADAIGAVIGIIIGNKIFK